MCAFLERHPANNAPESFFPNNLNDRLEQIFQRPETVEEMTGLGITTVPKGTLQHLFVEVGGSTNDSSAVRLINLKNVRIGEMNRRAFEERALPEALCAGIYVPDVGAIRKEILAADGELEHDEEALRLAIKKQAYTTAEYIRRSLVPSFRALEEAPSFYIAVGLDGQLALWEKLGFLSELAAFRPGAISPKEVIKTLFYDGEGHRNGPLSQAGISFQTQGVMVPGLDIFPDFRKLTNFCKFDFHLG